MDNLIIPPICIRFDAHVISVTSQVREYISHSKYVEKIKINEHMCNIDLYEATLYESYIMKNLIRLSNP